MQNTQEINWLAIIVPSVITGLFVLFTQILLAYKLTKITENYKKELSKELEDYKKDIGKDLYEFQTKFSLLHQERAAAIVEIYKLIATVEIKLKSLITVLNPVDKFDIDEELKGKYIFEMAKTIPALGDTLLNTFLQKQILLDEETCKIINDVVEPMNMANKFISFLALKEIGYSEFTDNSEERILKESNEFLNEIIPMAKKNLEYKFRQLLSVEKSISVSED